MSKLLSQRITSLREYKELTQADLAEIAGIEPSYLSKLERNKSPNVAGIILARIATALETTTDYLLGLTNDPNVHPPPNSPALLDPLFRQIMTWWEELLEEDDKKAIHFFMQRLALKR